jgi:hypothetical protein
MNRQPHPPTVPNDGQTLGTGVVLGERGFCLGERRRRDALGLAGEKVFSPEETVKRRIEEPRDVGLVSIRGTRTPSYPSSL